LFFTACLPVRASIEKKKITPLFFQKKNRKKKAIEQGRLEGLSRLLRYFFDTF